MTRTSRRPWVLALGVLTLSLGVLLFAWIRVRAARDGALYASGSLVRASEQALAIEELLRSPRKAVGEELGLTEFARAVEEAAEGAGVSPQQVVRIEPEPPSRAGESEYLRKSTRVELRRVTLTSLLRFTRGMHEAREGIFLRDIRLQAPHSERLKDSWNTELTLSYLIFSPKTKRDP